MKYFAVRRKGSERKKVTGKNKSIFFCTCKRGGGWFIEKEVIELARQSRKKVRDSILAALVAKGMDSSYFLDLVEDYMDLWDIKRKLRVDLQQRGPVVEWQNGANQKGLRKNDSVVEYPKISKRMTDILRQLEIDCRIEIDDPPEKEVGVDDQNGDEDIGL